MLSVMTAMISMNYMLKTIKSRLIKGGISQWRIYGKERKGRTTYGWQYRDVVLPEVECGNIIRFERQKKYLLQPSYIHNGKKVQPIEYKADYYVMYADGREQVIDIKGCPDAVAKLKRKMFWYVYPNIEYDWVGYSKIDGGWTTYETIQSGRKERRRLKKTKAKENKE